MSENARIQAERNVMMQKHLDAKQQMAQQKEITDMKRLGMYNSWLESVV